MLHLKQISVADTIVEVQMQRDLFAKLLLRVLSNTHQTLTDLPIETSSVSEIALPKIDEENTVS